MKITICAYDVPGNIDGPSAWIKRLLPWLSERGVQVRVIFFAANTKNLPVYHFLKKAGISATIIFWELFQEEKVRALLNDIKLHPPDVFIANYFPVACAASAWIRDAGIPTVLVLHNDDAFHYALITEYVNKSPNSIDVVVSVSKSITTTIEKNIPANVLLTTIPCGAPLPGKTVLLPFEGNLKIVYAGRIDEKQKQISAVTRAFCLAAKQVPGTEYIIYGSGPAVENVIAILKNEGKDLPVAYGGALESNTILENFLQHHVFVLLSDFEGIPISLMEAMGCGLVPVCTFIKSGVIEMIEDGVNGLLVKDRSESFVEAIRKIKSNPDLHLSMASTARSTIEKEYTSEICNLKWLRLLEEISQAPLTKKEIRIPSIHELKKYNFPKELVAHANPMPSSFLVPFVRLKHFIGRVKRKISH
jgi:colanic acid/amylovoran biosynthesis glycosyltransferase